MIAFRSANITLQASATSAIPLRSAEPVRCTYRVHTVSAPMLFEWSEETQWGILSRVRVFAGPTHPIRRARSSGNSKTCLRYAPRTSALKQGQHNNPHCSWRPSGPRNGLFGLRLSALYCRAGSPTAITHTCESAGTLSRYCCAHQTAYPHSRAGIALSP